MWYERFSFWQLGDEYSNRVRIYAQLHWYLELREWAAKVVGHMERLGVSLGLVWGMGVGV